MQLLRKILRDSIPELADALERSWTIALDEWLAAIAPQLDSFNAYPHLRNHEKHLERIWLAYQRHHGTSARPLLSPIEIYVMLSSILFHDIGRTRTGKDHGEASKVIIDSYRAELGIPSDALAHVIARISRFHDLPARRMREELDDLATTSIDPYGEIRQSACAALLTLIDYMDGTFTRVTPAYIRENEDMKPVGAFRRVIRDVEIDLEGELVKIVLGDLFEEIRKEPAKAPEWKLKPDFKRYTTEELVTGSGKPVLPEPNALAELNNQPASCSPPAWSPSDVQKFLEQNSVSEGVRRGLFAKVAFREPAFGEQLVARQYARCAQEAPAHLDFLEKWKKDPAERVEALVGRRCLDDFLEETDVLWGRVLPCDPKSPIRKELEDRSDHMAEAARKHEGWPRELLLAVILGNCRENADVLRQIRQTLWSMGVPVRAWVVEWKEHLFNELGAETMEPMLSPKELDRTLESMVSLATRSPRSAVIPYDTLAAEARESKVAKTRRAVRRIGIVWRNDRAVDLPKSPTAPASSGIGKTGAPIREPQAPTILVGQEEWRMLPGGFTDGGWLVSVRELKTRLNNLKHADVGGAK
jgi:hypothetical protein